MEACVVSNLAAGLLRAPHSSTAAAACAPGFAERGGGGGPQARPNAELHAGCGPAAQALHRSPAKHLTQQLLQAPDGTHQRTLKGPQRAKRGSSAGFKVQSCWAASASGWLKPAAAAGSAGTRGTSQLAGGHEHWTDMRASCRCELQVRAAEGPRRRAGVRASNTSVILYSAANGMPRHHAATISIRPAGNGRHHGVACLPRAAQSVRHAAAAPRRAMGQAGRTLILCWQGRHLWPEAGRRWRQRRRGPAWRLPTGEAPGRRAWCAMRGVTPRHGPRCMPSAAPIPHPPGWKLST